MTDQTVPKSMSIPLGVVLRRQPGVTRWAKWAWCAVAVIPNAGPGEFRTLRDEDGVTDFHAATVPLDLHHTEVESYRTSLAMSPPSIINSGSMPLRNDFDILVPVSSSTVP